MKQYTYTATNTRTGRTEQVRCTAADAHTARWHVVNYYGSSHTIGTDADRTDPPHRFAGEIDASSREHYETARDPRTTPHTPEQYRALERAMQWPEDLPAYDREHDTTPTNLSRYLGKLSPL